MVYIDIMILWYEHVECRVLWLPAITCIIQGIFARVTAVSCAASGRPTPITAGMTRPLTGSVDDALQYRFNTNKATVAI
jgi:hypothetical protein